MTGFAFVALMALFGPSFVIKCVLNIMCGLAMLSVASAALKGITA
jgi:hypothetical protein